MTSKRKGPDTAATLDRAEKRAKSGRKDKEIYSSQQKAALAQFMTFTQLDRNTAIRALKSHGWDAQTAVNAHYGSGGASAGSGAAKANLTKIFDKYREANTTEPDTIGAEGTMQYFGDTDVNVEGLESLAVLELVQAPTMGEMSREGFIKGWQERNCDTVDKQKAYIKTLKRELPGSKDLFTRIYRYTFTVAKAPGQKAVPLDMAIAYWELLFSSSLSAVQWASPNTPWLSWWTEFLTSSWKKSVNKDMWNETLKFAQLTLLDEAMSFWNEESSWPSVIDEFVEWVKNEKRGGSQENPMEEEN